MGEARVWPALTIEGAPEPPDTPLALAELVSSLLDDFNPLAIEDLTPCVILPGGLWDPTWLAPTEAEDARLHWRAYFSSSDLRDSARAALRISLPHLKVDSVDVPDEDWARRSQRAVTAVTAGAFVVAPPWDLPRDPPDNSVVVVIEPSRGFGTGHHASTRLCLRALSTLSLAGARVLDLGTGSGVLAIAAALRRAAQVTAVDLDADAIDAARASARLNDVQVPLEWLVGDFRTPRGNLARRPFDVVVANLTGGLLRTSAARIRELVSPTGCLIVSGFDEAEWPDVGRALGLPCRAVYEEEGWIGAVLDGPGGRDAIV
ncbi:MAG: 50S ribosomal protein L11 methyltransferase [Acidobacteriota bacterium]